MRIALLTLDSLVSTAAVARFIRADPARITLVGLSDPYRPSAGGALGQALRHWRRSGPGLLPYLLANFSLPRLAGATVVRTCEALGVPHATVTDVNGDHFRRRLAASGAELVLTFHFDQIIGAETLGVTPLGGLNVHPSLLPRHRGPTPTIHALLEPVPTFGVTVHRLAPRIDAGAVVAQSRVTLPPGVTALAAARRLHEAAAPLLETAVAAVADGSAPDVEAATLPYQGFPTAAELRRLRRLGRSAADWRDVRAAFATAI